MDLCDDMLDEVVNRLNPPGLAMFRLANRKCAQAVSRRLTRGAGPHVCAWACAGVCYVGYDKYAQLEHVAMNGYVSLLAYYREMYPVEVNSMRNALLGIAIRHDKSEVVRYLLTGG